MSRCDKEDVQLLLSLNTRIDERQGSSRLHRWSKWQVLLFLQRYRSPQSETPKYWLQRNGYRVVLMIFNLISVAEPAQPPSFFSPFNYSFERIVTRSAPAVESGPDLWHRPSLNLLMVRRNRPRWTSSQDSPNSTTLVEPVGCCLPQVSTPNQIEFSHLKAGMRNAGLSETRKEKKPVRGSGPRVVLSKPHRLHLSTYPLQMHSLVSWQRVSLRDRKRGRWPR